MLFHMHRNRLDSMIFDETYDNQNPILFEKKSEAIICRIIALKQNQAEYYKFVRLKSYDFGGIF